MNTFEWYTSLQKPFFAPPSWIFGPVWSVLYILIAIAVLLSIQEVISGSLSKKIVMILIINIASNLLFTPLQFGLKSNELASIDILIVLLSTIAWIIFVKQHPVLPWLLAPYALWVSFATVLQLSITFLNR